MARILTTHEDFWYIILETEDIIGKKNIEKSVLKNHKTPKFQINSEENCKMLEELFDEVTRLKEENQILKNLILRQKETDN